MKILALNAGSRSHRAQLFAFDGIPSLEPPRAAWDAADESATGRFAELLETYRGEPPDAVVHRFVHPGPELAERIAFRVDDEARSLIERSDLAPAHNPLALDGLRAASDRFAGAVQIGISDIASGPMHPRSLPPIRYHMPGANASAFVVTDFTGSASATRSSAMRGSAAATIRRGESCRSTSAAAARSSPGAVGSLSIRRWV
jgi:hypothetical protein